MAEEDPFKIEDPSGLEDADYAALNKLRRAYEEGGEKGLSLAFEALSKDPLRYIRVVGAMFPDMTREAIKDELAAKGIDEEDLAEMKRKVESPARDQ
ncbi:hypothetical protein [Bradyrhizobium sp. G127]|uniref:hypothetical protein n=1 Tax=Bradyrhizobium sp. G127 TaxID=2904800 RepID=UPI001F27E268|nr:hypothetical protein [Bradyrhizobium sp. G127]MCF2523899.1 hypothetical protein [Bradyrhizobium sp. G127]